MNFHRENEDLGLGKQHIKFDVIKYSAWKMLGYDFSFIHLLFTDLDVKGLLI